MSFCWHTCFIFLNSKIKDNIFISGSRAKKLPVRREYTPITEICATGVRPQQNCRNETRIIYLFKNTHHKLEHFKAIYVGFIFVHEK